MAGVSSCAFLIFPNTLFADTTALKNVDRVFIVEEPLFFGGKEASKGRQYSIAKMKLVYMRATMKTYEKKLQKNGFNTTYVDYDNVKGYEWLAKSSTIRTYEIIDFELIEKLQAYPHLDSLQMKETLLFPLPLAKICSYFTDLENDRQPKRYSHSHFYKWAKQEMNILTHVKSYDTQNRQPLPRNHRLKHHTPDFFCQKSRNDMQIVEEAKRYIESHAAFANNVGLYRHLSMYPLDHEGAMQLFKDFIKNRLDCFGPYQDAIDKDEPILYHSFCSTVLNNGLLASDWVIKQLKKGSEHLRIESLEAYVRQLCWRMWEVGIYLCFHDELRNSNHFSSTKKLNWKVWRGHKHMETGMHPIDNEVRKAIEYGYAAHIPRLMIFLNVFVMLQIRPNDVVQWFMEIVSMDATIYFMWPIVTTMGGYNLRFMQKPYISTSAYLLKMSNYPKGEWCETFTALFYDFLARNKSKLKGSCSIYLRNLAYYERKGRGEQARSKRLAQAFRKRVTEK